MEFEFDWLLSIVEIAGEHATVFSTWFISELRDYDLAKILETIAAVLAIGFALWRIWKAIIAKPAKALLVYLQKREGEILSQKIQIVGGLTEQYVGGSKRPDEELKYVDTDKRISKSIELFKRGKTRRADEKLRSLIAHLHEKEELAKNIATTTRMENATVHLLVGIFAYFEGQYSDASLALNKSLSLNPEEFEAKKHLGLIELDSGNSEGALISFNDLLQIAQGNSGLQAEARRLQGFTYLQNEQPQLAINSITEALKIENNYGDTLAIAKTKELLGDANYQCKNWQKAEKLYKSSFNNYRTISLKEDETRSKEKYEKLQARALNNQQLDLNTLLVGVKSLLSVSFRSRRLSSPS